MTHDELRDKLIATSDWRWRKAEEYPQDSRNPKAAELLAHLATTTADVPQHLLDAYEAAVQRAGDQSLHNVVLAEDAVFRAIGFQFEPENPEAIVRELLEQLSCERRRGFL